LAQRELGVYQDNKADFNGRICCAQSPDNRLVKLSQMRGKRLKNNPASLLLWPLVKEAGKNKQPAEIQGYFAKQF